MNKTFLTILASIFIVIGAAFLFINKYFIFTNWSLIPRADYNSIILSDEISQSAQAGDTDQQIEAAQELVRIKGSDNEAKLELANAYLEKASLDYMEEEYGNKALVLANEVLAKEPDNYKAYIVVGYAYEVLQDYTKSLEAYNKAIELNPNYDIAYVKRGHAYDLSGDLAAAESDYTKAYELNNKNDVAIMNLARIAQRAGDFEKAVNYAKIAVELSNIAYVKATSYEILGLADLEVDNYQAAIDNFTKSVQSYQDYANAYTNRAYAKILLADYTVTSDVLKREIEQDVLKTLEIYPGDTFAVVVRGLLMEAVSDKTAAKTYYQTALGMVDKDITLGLIEKEDMRGKINQLIINLDTNE